MNLLKVCVGWGEENVPESAGKSLFLKRESGLLQGNEGESTSQVEMLPMSRVETSHHVFLYLSRGPLYF